MYCLQALKAQLCITFEASKGQNYILTTQSNETFPLYVCNISCTVMLNSANMCTIL